MQQVRLWEITPDRKLLEIPARHSGLEWFGNVGVGFQGEV